MENNFKHKKLGKTIKFICLVLFYYFLCIILSFVTKFFISENGYNFRFPVLKSAMNNFCHFAGALVILSYKNQNTKVEQPLETFACALIGSIDIGISIYALRQVDLAYYTIIKSATPVFILLSGFCLGTEKINLITLCAMMLIALRTFMVTVRPVKTNSMDIYLLLGSAIVSGFRWSFIQFILKRKKSNVFIAIRDICLPTSILLFIYSLRIYGIKDIVTSEFFKSISTATFNMLLITILGMASLIILICELTIVKKTSVLFLSVCAVLKELAIVGISIVRCSKCMSKLNYMGIVISILGILLYNAIKSKRI